MATSTPKHSTSNGGTSRKWTMPSLPHILPKPGEKLEGSGFEDIRLEEGVEAGEDLALDDRKLPVAYQSGRHVEAIVGSAEGEAQTWRSRERMKTVSVALVVCLNVGVDPPDVIKTQPCAKLECWIDPHTLNGHRAIEMIGNSLQRQYERWQSRARYRQSLDPTVDEVRRLAIGLRRNAREERVLFHYNGHGVPKPTANGEIWVFNRSYTQYIPLSLYDLQAWMGSPSIYVYDCSNAGIIVRCFEQFAEQHDKENFAQQGKPSSGLGSGVTPQTSMRNCIQLAACSANQLLPMNPDLPADLFTACLTTPIKMALRWFVMQNQSKLAPKITVDMLEKIPGQFPDRRTMLGELNWIFTAITDTIAWNTLPRALFQKLFRQDLLVASLFRNFLLAERVMRSYDCTPVSHPPLPPTHQHPMWQAWDLAVDISLSQLPEILEKGATYKASMFFEEQLTAFEVWLKYGNEHRPPPEQLPIVLQVLLSQAHRLKALDLLGQFLDLGPWAVNLALSVGIFPYVLRLLQSTARELRPLLVSIWAKILAVDTSCQTDLIRESSHKYFLSVLQDECMMPQHRTWAAFILASIVHNYKEGQKEADSGNLISIALEHLDDRDPVLRQWLAVALGRVWDHYEPARWKGARNNAHEKLYELLKDPVPEVRASAVFALGTFVNSCEDRTEHAYSQDQSIALQILNTVSEDGSPLVRQELVVALQYVVNAFEPNFVAIARQEEEERAALSEQKKSKEAAYNPYNTITSSASTANFAALVGGAKTRKHASLRLPEKQLQPSASSSALDRLAGGPSAGQAPVAANRSSSNLASPRPSVGGTYSKLWNGLNQLSADPFPEVSSMAMAITQYIRNKAGSGMKTGSLEAFSSMPSSPSKSHERSFQEAVTQCLLQPPASGPYDSNNKEALAQRLHGAQGAANARSFTVIKKDESLQAKRAARRSGGAAGGSNGGRHPSGSHRGDGGHLDLSKPSLSTEFLPWSAKYFNKQLMRHECVDCVCDHESPRHWRKEWLYNRNNSVRLEAESQFELIQRSNAKLDVSSRSVVLKAGQGASASSAAVFRMPQTGAPASVIAFHPYNDKVVVAGHNHINMWDVGKGELLSSPVMKPFTSDWARLNRISNFRTAQVTSMDYLNAHEDALLLVASDDGSLRLFKDQEDEDEEWVMTTHKLVSAWNGLRDIAAGNQAWNRGAASLALMPVASGLPVHTAWSQFDLTLAVGGYARHIRLWDAERELKKADLNTGSDSYVSSLRCSNYYAASSAASGIFTAGFGDGSVKLFDIRSRDSRVATFNELDSPVLECRLQETNLTGYSGHPAIIAGSSDGEVRVFEMRNPSGSLGSLSFGQTISALDIHHRAPLVAAWTESQQTVSINLFKRRAGGDNQLQVGQLNTVKYHDEGVLGTRLGAEGCLTFHPHLAQLAVGSKDGAISIKNIRKNNN